MEEGEEAGVTRLAQKSSLRRAANALIPWTCF
jgi:hypothetical protein